MESRFNEIMSILHQKITSEDICNKIMEMVQHSEHADKMINVYSDIIKIKYSLFDPSCLSSISCNQLYNCNCCRRHQRDKPLINYTDYVISSVSIITKPCVFNPNHKFDKPESNSYSCECPCRHYTREVMREHLMQVGCLDIYNVELG